MIQKEKKKRTKSKTWVKKKTKTKTITKTFREVGRVSGLSGFMVAKKECAKGEKMVNRVK